MQKYSVPDFAFPKTVQDESSKLLEESLREGNDEMALRAAMNLIVSRQLLSSSNDVAPRISLLDSVASKLQNPYKAIALLIEAQILEDAYSQNGYIYNERNLPLEEPFPEDTDEWSAQMFRKTILEKINAATDVKFDEKTGINVISSLLVKPENAEKIDMTLFDFIFLKSSEILTKATPAGRENIIPFFPDQMANSVDGQCRDKTLKLLNSLIESPAVNSVVKAVAYNKLFYLLPDYERENFLRKGIETLTGEEGQGSLLYEWWNRYLISDYSTPEFSHCYTAMKEWLTLFPNSIYQPMVSYAISEILAESMSINFPSIALPHTPVEGNIEIKNLAKGYLLVFKLEENQVNESDNLIPYTFKFSKSPFKTIEIDNGEAAPFSKEMNFTLPPLPAGIYAVIPSDSPSLPKKMTYRSLFGRYATIRVSDIAIITSFDSNEKGSGKVYVVNAKNQQPIEGAKVTYSFTDSSKKKKDVFTNREGFTVLPDGYFNVVASLGKNIVKKNAGFRYYPESKIEELHATILTDLAIYRPADSVKFVVMGWKRDSLQDSLITGKEMEVRMLDAGWSEVAKTTVTLNQEGRAWGELQIPEGHLLGRYQLQATFLNERNSIGGNTDFRVEEYKLPAFLVTLEQKESNEPDILNFSGNVLTFSGMPVTNATTQISIDFSPWRWGLGLDNASYSMELATDSKGQFEFTLPVKNVKGTVFETGRYIIKASVTSEAGETETSAPLFFYLGQGLNIRPAIQDFMEVTQEEISFNVPVYDLANLPVKEEVEYEIFGEEKEMPLMEGKFVSPTLEIPAKDLPSGRYLMKFKIGESVSHASVVIWRASDIKAPYDTPLWVPKQQYYYSADDKFVDVKFGSFHPGWILCVVSDSEKVISSEWIAPNDSLMIKRIEVPRNDATLFVTLAGMHDFNSSTNQIKIQPTKDLEKLEIVTESFRENITAGQREKWKFQFKVSDLTPASSQEAPYVNVMAVMSDMALNSLAPFRWTFNIWSPAIYTRFRLNEFNWHYTGASHIFSKIQESNAFISLVPNWETYGYPWIATPDYYSPGRVLYASAAPMMRAKNMNSYEMESDDDMEVEESVLEESKSVTSDMAIQTRGSLPDAESSTQEPSEQLRPVEMPLAFFLPDLKADENGIITLDFEVPNFNTTWQLQVAGYTSKLLNAVKILETVASKPVMVKSNLPQFLRTGDKAQISATIYNNSADSLEVSGKIVVLNPLSGEILQENAFSDVSLGASDNFVFSVDFDVPDNVSVIAVKTYAGSGKHNDGEQGIVPVMPSSTPVVEAKTFYAKSDEASVKVKIPKLSKNSTVVLKYCDNPLWEVLMALPSVTLNENAGALSIGRWIYGALTSLDIVTNNPSIYSGLKSIIESKDSSLTQSALEKDAPIKITALEASPWLLDAQAETSRIRSLEIYLHPEKIMEKVKQKIKDLETLQNSDGGFSWFEGFHSSPFITCDVITGFGYLKQQGLLSEEMEKMARKAVKYYDGWLIEMWKKKETKPSVLSVMNYFYSRSMLEFPLNGEIKKIQKETLKSISQDWRHWDEARKAKGALLLFSDDDYRQEALTIAASLEEFLSKRLPLVSEAYMLELFQKLQPGSLASEMVKEAMFLQKETQDWAAEYNVPALAYILMKSCGENYASRSLPEILIDGTPLELPKSQTLTGNFTINLDPGKVSGKDIEISREPGLPAWGGVISQFVAPIRDVKKAGVENLSVEKRIFLQDEKGELKEVKTFKKGDRVTVVLNISCQKNMDYIVVTDSRAACLQPSDRISGLHLIDGLLAYQEVRSDKTSFFIETLPAGKTVLSYECVADREGEYSLGIAEVQCLYSPAQVAHSAGKIVIVK